MHSSWALSLILSLYAHHGNTCICNASLQPRPLFGKGLALRALRAGGAAGWEETSKSVFRTSWVVSLRGGGGIDSDEYDFESESDDSDSDSTDDHVTDEESNVTDEGEEIEEVSEDEDDDEEESEELDEDEEDLDNDEEDEEDEEEAPINTSPVKIILKTALLSKNTHTSPLIIDQSIEITASRSRSVYSLKQSVFRQFKSRPPMNGIVLRFDGQVLDDDDVLVEELVEDLDLDDEEDEDDDDDDEDDNDGMMKLTITVDIVPPVDPKFGTEMKERLDQMTNAQVLDAYAANLAAMHRNSMEVMKNDDDYTSIVSDNDDDDDEDEDNDEDNAEEEESIVKESANLLMRKDALRIKEQIMSSLSEQDLELLSKLDTPASPFNEEDDGESIAGGDVMLKESIKNKRRKRKGGATMNVKRALQKNLNINWPDTIRNSILFLFFGYFGGRNPMSRTIMLLGAPACFISQARPVKVCAKQLFYTIGEPPGLFLSLLAAPQQTIMSCKYDDAMKNVYGDDVGKFNELIHDDEISTNSGNSSVEDDDDDLSSYDEESDCEYDDEYDDESDF